MKYASVIIFSLKYGVLALNLHGVTQLGTRVNYLHSQEVENAACRIPNNLTGHLSSDY